MGLGDHAGFLSGRLTSSNVGTCVLPNQDSNVAPQTSQDAWPVCGTRNFVSVRLYSAPQSHWTIVAILGISAFGELVQVTTPGLGCSAPIKVFDLSLARNGPDRLVWRCPLIGRPDVAG